MCFNCVMVASSWARAGRTTLKPYLRMLELLPEPTLLISGEGEVLAANPGVEECLGLTAEGLCGMRLTPLADNVPAFTEYLNACSNSKTLLPGSATFSVPGGSRRSYLLEGALLREKTQHQPSLVLLRLVPPGAAANPDLQPSERIEELSQEVQREKEIQGLLKESEQRFRQLAERITDVFWILDPHARRMLYVSPAYEAMWGRPCESLYEDPESFAEPVIEEDRPLVQATMEAQLRGEQTVAEFRIVRPDGAVRCVSSRAFPITDDHGRVYRICGIIEDITERNAIEQSLHQHNQRLRLLRDVAVYLLVVRDPDAMMRGLFDQLSQHFSLDAYLNYLVTETGDALRLASSAGVAESALKSLSRLQFGQGICGAVALRREPIVATNIQEGEDPSAEAAKGLGFRAYACFPLITDSKLLGTLSFASRATDQFAGSELQFFQTVSHYVTATYDRLNLVRELKDADRRKDLFLATLAHELRNPLAPVSNALDLMGMARGDAQQVEDLRVLAAKQIRQMVRLIDDLLDVSRITRDKIELRKERVELATAIENAIETARPLVEAAKHELTVTLPAERVFLEADPVRLAQVFANLLSNAAKYTEDGGKIWLSAEATENQVKVRFKDTGIGFSQELVPYLFEFFAQGRQGRDRPQGGLGIGLALARRLAELHGGTVNASSPGEGKGAEFVVTLPRLPSPISTAPRQPALSPSLPPPQGALRILVVDDNQVAAMTMGMLLRHQGHAVETAASGPAAIKTAHDFQPQVVLLDIGLPGMDGFEVARLLRKQPETRSALLVAVTGYGQDEDRKRSKAAGFDHHLVKPVDVRQVAQILSTVATGPRS